MLNRRLQGTVLSTYSGIASFATLAALTALAACSGNVTSASSGTTATTASQLETVALSDVTAAVGTCAEGSEHPNVCCTENADAPAACAAWVNDPFHPCEDGTVTHPHPTKCCELADGTKCGPAGGPQDAEAPREDGGECRLPCGPGDFEDPTNGGACSPAGHPACGGGTGPSGPIPQDAAAPPIPDDAAPPAPPAQPGAPGANEPRSGHASPPPPPATDAAAPPAPPPPPNHAPACTPSCPTGFTADSAHPELCCADLASGDRKCFSTVKGYGPRPPAPSDAGAPPAPPVPDDAEAPRHH